MLLLGIDVAWKHFELMVRVSFYCDGDLEARIVAMQLKSLCLSSAVIFHMYFS